MIQQSLAALDSGDISAVTIFAGEWLHSRINPRVFRLAVYTLLMLSGVALTVR